MDFTHITQTRKSVHNFLPNQKITRQTFEAIINETRTTPSGYNAQPWHFILIQNEETLKTIESIAFGQKHIRESGNAVLILGNTAFGQTEQARICEEWTHYRQYNEQQIKDLRNSLNKTRSEEQWKSMTLRNASFAAMTFLLSAKNHGWDTCPMMGFSQNKIKTLLEVPSQWIPILLVALGKQDTTKKEQAFPRKPIESIVSYESF